MNLKSLLLFMPLLFMTGCQPGQESQANTVFPKQMVGVWGAKVNDKGIRWIIRFEPDGSVYKIHHFAANKVDLREGGTSWDGRDESHFVFIFEDAQTKYTAADNRITLTIPLVYYRMELKVGTLEGNMKDVISGIASEDGETWPVEWRSYGHLDGAAEPPEELIEKHPMKLIFKKMGTPKPD